MSFEMGSHMKDLREVKTKKKKNKKKKKKAYIPHSYDCSS